MNYDTAKKLKEAGFPKKTWLVLGPDRYRFHMPTLSELIEACGQCLSHIKRLRVNDADYWWAVSHCGHPEHEWSGNNLEECGETPEEAVANLWLALNRKEK